MRAVTAIGRRYHRCSRCAADATHLTLESRASLVSPIFEEEAKAEWTFMCLGCGRRNPTYYIDLPRIRTERQALAWTIHLSRKIWFNQTQLSWRAILIDLFPGVESVI